MKRRSITAWAVVKKRGRVVLGTYGTLTVFLDESTTWRHVTCRHETVIQVTVSEKVKRR